MKYFTVLFITMAMVCGALASPSAVEDHSLVRHRRQVSFEIFGNTVKLIEELIANLNKAADQAKQAVVQFRNGLLEQANKIREKLIADINKIREKISESIKKIQDKFTNSGSAVGECINAHRDDAETILSTAQTEALSCINSRIEDVGEMINKLNSLCETGQDIASAAVEEMRNCTENHSSNILAAGACLGTVAVKTEMKASSFLMQSGLAIGRLNLFMATLPAQLEMCAGSSLVNAGVSTARILMEIGSCSATSVINNFTGTSSVGELASSATSTISGAASNTASTASNAANTAGSDAASLASNLSNAASTSGSNVGSMASSVASTASNAASNLASAFTSGTTSGSNLVPIDQIITGLF